MRGLLANILDFTNPHKKKSQGVRAQDQQITSAFHDQLAGLRSREAEFCTRAYGDLYAKFDATKRLDIQLLRTSAN